jgi:hypothetical protein
MVVHVPYMALGMSWAGIHRTPRTRWRPCTENEFSKYGFYKAPFRKSPKSECSLGCRKGCPCQADKKMGLFPLCSSFICSPSLQARSLGTRADEAPCADLGCQSAGIRECLPQPQSLPQHLSLLGWLIAWPAWRKMQSAL